MWESYDQPGRKARKKKEKAKCKAEREAKAKQKKKLKLGPRKLRGERLLIKVYSYYDPITVVVGLLGDGLSYYRDSGE